MKAKAQYSLLRKYVVKEFFASFLVAFTFFFFIFFINQILLLIQKVMIKSVSIADMIKLVSLAVPQFLIYTFPFSSLSAASMVVGEFSAQNEIIAMRSVGIPYRRIFAPILLLGIVLSVTTFFIADVVVPFSSVRYQQEYKGIMEKIPTLELTSYSSVTVGDKIITAGKVEEDIINDIILFDAEQRKNNQTISATQGKIGRNPDTPSWEYELELQEPIVLTTSDNEDDSWSFMTADRAILTVDFSHNAQSLTSITPSQMSTRDLLAAIEVRNQRIKEQKQENLVLLEAVEKEMRAVQARQNQLDIPDEALEKETLRLDSKRKSLINERFEDFYATYYTAELNKKFALSAACFFLILTALPISFIKIKHGRLIGFGLSLFIACAYWFILFFAQMQIFDVSFSPAWLIWFPNILLSAVGLFFLGRQARI